MYPSKMSSRVDTPFSGHPFNCESSSRATRSNGARDPRKRRQFTDTIQVELDESGEGEAVFEHSSSRTGRFAYEVSTPVQREDAVPGNNRYPVVVRVVREKMRVLQVCGSPSYDQENSCGIFAGRPQCGLG